MLIISNSRDKDIFDVLKDGDDLPPNAFALHTQIRQAFSNDAYFPPGDYDLNNIYDIIKDKVETNKFMDVIKHSVRAALSYREAMNGRVLENIGKAKWRFH